LKILIFTQWFDPEPAFKGLAFAKELKNRGHHVEILTGFPNYPGGQVYPGYSIKLYHKELMDGIIVHRVALYPDHGTSAFKRILNYVSFGFCSCLAGLFKLPKFDVIYAYHPPLTTSLSAALVSLLRRTPVVLDVQDLWPDTLAATGMLSNKKLLKVVGWFCNFVYKRVTKIAVLSPGFKDRLIDRGVPAEKISVIYNWCDEKALDTAKKSSHKLPEYGFNLVFAGNLGHAQGLNALVHAAKIIKEKHIAANFVFIGDGVAKEDAQNLVKKFNLDNVYFIPRVPITEIGSLLKLADGLLVHLLDDELFRITIPSRTQTNMYVGKPILMAVNGDAADLIEYANAGVLAEPNMPNSIAESLATLVNLTDEQLQAMGDNAHHFYMAHLSMDSGVNSFIELFKKVAK
jgi:glycosyltransferase involved in cell wall biosynthesis